MSTEPPELLEPSSTEVHLPPGQTRVIAVISGIIGLAIALYLVFYQYEIIGGPILGLAAWAIVYAVVHSLLSWRLGVHERGERLGLRHLKEPVREVAVGMVVLPIFFACVVAAVWALQLVGLDARSEWLNFLLIFMVLGGLLALCGMLGISVVALFLALPIWGLIGYFGYELFGPHILSLLESLFG